MDLSQLQELTAPTEWPGEAGVAACNLAHPLPMLWTPLRRGGD